MIFNCTFLVASISETSIIFSVTTGNFVKLFVPVERIKKQLKEK